MKDTKDIILKSRRDFMGMVSKAGISTALLRASPLVAGLMANRSAHASGTACRAIFVYTPDGAPNDLWLPSGTTLNQATLAYEGLQSVCNFREVEVIGSGHGLARKCLGELRWTQDWTSDTIDQQIASVIGVTTPYRAYTLGVQANPQEAVGRRSGDSVPPQNSPAAAYQQLFGGDAPPPSDTAGHLARKRSVMDVNRLALNELKGKLGTFERQSLDKHEAALAEVEQRLIDSTNIEPTEGCASPAWNENGYPTEGPIEGNVGIFAHQAELQSDITVAAMQCGLTNVVTLQLGWHQAVWYGHDTNYRGDHHGSCHAAPASDNAEMTNYLSRCVAYLVRKLVDTDDPAVPGTKMIDNTVVVQVTDMGDGRDHSGGNGPNMVATRMPGFRRGTVTRGGNNYEVLEAVVEGMGLSQYKGTNVNTHRIWPCAGGSIAGDILA